MTRKKPGARRGAKPQNDEKFLDAMATELIKARKAGFEFDTDSKVGGKVTYSEHAIEQVYKAVQKKLNGVAPDHDHADRKRICRKFRNEFDFSALIASEDGYQEIHPRIEKMFGKAKGLKPLHGTKP